MERIMLKFHWNFLLAGSFLLMLSGCESVSVNQTALLESPHYWQRVESSSAIYQRGPKAQQMLHRDISRCVTEIRELERLGAIRRVTPGETMNDGTVPDSETPEGSMAEWDTPERDGYLRAEHLDYHDFETCMMEKGWERIEHVPYNIAEESREDYIEAITGERYRTRMGERNNPIEEPKGDFDNLND